MINQNIGRKTSHFIVKKIFGFESLSGFIFTFSYKILIIIFGIQKSLKIYFKFLVSVFLKRFFKRVLLIYHS